MPTRTASGCFSQHCFKLSQFLKHLAAFGAELLWLVFKRGQQGCDGVEALLAGVPLRRHQGPRVSLDTRAFGERGHQVFVGGDELDQRPDAKLQCELFDWVFVARECTPVDEMSYPGSSPSTTMYIAAAMR